VISHPLPVSWSVYILWEEGRTYRDSLQYWPMDSHRPRRVAPVLTVPVGR